MGTQNYRFRLVYGNGGRTGGRRMKELKCTCNHGKFWHSMIHPHVCFFMIEEGEALVACNCERYESMRKWKWGKLKKKRFGKFVAWFNPDGGIVKTRVKK